MSFDPTKPVNSSLIVAAELRGQFNGLKALLDAIPAGPPGPQGPAGSMTWGFNWQGTWSAQVYGAARPPCLTSTRSP